MNRFKNISLVYECDRSTLTRATTLAANNRARLTIVYPIQEVPSSWSQLSVGQTPIDVRKLVYRQARAQLNEVADAVRKLGVSAKTRVLVGDPFIEIIRDVIEHQRDLLIMTAEGQGGLRQRLFGSTSTHVMRKCPTPVLIMKPGRQKRFRRILAAIDPELTGDVRDTLNGPILELASSLSGQDDAVLHVAHAWTFYGEAYVRKHSGTNARLFEAHIKKEGRRRRELVETLLTQHSITNAQFHVRKGDAADVIPHLVNKLKIDLLVMGTVCRTGIPGLIVGNTAERVLDSVGCSVLTVKPAGFVSPIAPLVAAKQS